MSLNYKPKSEGLFEKIESEGEALRTIKVVTSVFFGAAALQAVLFVSVAPILVILPAIIAGLALAIRLNQNRIAAYILAGLILLNLAAQVLEVFIAGFLPFAGFAISAVLGWCAIRAVQATTALHRIRNQKPPTLPPAVPPPAGPSSHGR